MDRCTYRSRSGLIKHSTRIKQIFRRPGGHRLAVMLHGYKDDPTSLFTAVETLDPETRFRFVVPRAPFETPDGPTWFAADPSDHPQQRLVDSLSELDELIEDESNTLGTRPEEAIVIGYSQGGAVALALGLRAMAPVRFTAVASIAGYLPAEDGLEWDFTEAAGITEMLIVHGVDDDQVPVLQGRSASNVLRRHGINCGFVEIDAGHSLEPELLAPVAEWLRGIDDP